MRRFFHLILLIALLPALQACAQGAKLVVKSSGYYVIPTPGTIAVDDNGRPVNTGRDTVFMLFVETGKEAIQWDHAWKGGRSFTVIPSLVTKEKVTVGQSQAGNRQIQLAPSKGNSLWHIELAEDPQGAKAPQPISANEVLLKGHSRKKTVFTKIPALTELASPMYQ